MNTFIAQFDTYTLTAILVFLASVMVLLASFRMIRRVQIIQKQHHNTVTSLKRDMRALTTAAVSVGQRVQEVERRQRHIDDNKQKYELPDIYEPANQPYEQAIRMVKNGAKKEDLVSTCGLSANEAELISMLHRLDKTA